MSLHDRHDRGDARSPLATAAHQGRITEAWLRALAKEATRWCGSGATRSFVRKVPLADSP